MAWCSWVSLRGSAVVAPLVAGAAALTTATWYGCAIYDTSLLEPAPLLADASPDVATPDAGPDADSCTHARAPARPTRDDGPGDLEVINALRTFDMGLVKDGGAPTALGFDLDGVCTCPGPPSCRARALNAQHCDDEMGRDNSGGQLLRNFAIVSGGVLSEESVNQRLEEGSYGLVVRVRGYNGKANDPQVEVSVFLSNGTVDKDGDPVKPTWAGTDRWTLDSKSVFGGQAPVIPNFVDAKAYVTDHVLVASLDFPLSLGGSNTNGVLTLELTGSIITAELAPERGTFKVARGQIAGRWPIKKLLGAVTALNDPVRPGQNVCPGSPSYADVKSLICRGADIASDPMATSRDAPCDALSVGFGFTGVPAVLGPVVTLPPERPTCPDAGPPEDCDPAR